MNATTAPQATSEEIAAKAYEIYADLHKLLNMIELGDDENVKRVVASMAKLARVRQTYRDASLRGE